MKNDEKPWMKMGEFQIRLVTLLISFLCRMCLFDNIPRHDSEYLTYQCLEGLNLAYLCIKMTQKENYRFYQQLTKLMKNTSGDE